MVEAGTKTELEQRIVREPQQAERFLNESYALLKRIHNYGDWNAEYHSDAATLWDLLGEWMYPDRVEGL